jgi:peptidoglycan hydrolase-like protein with peptidoglycan-binding domain
VSEEQGDKQDSPAEGGSRWPRRLIILISLTVVVILLASGFVFAAFAMSGATLRSDPDALARVDTEALGGTVVKASAVGAGGRVIPVSVHDGRLTPDRRLAPGERVSVDLVVRRPGMIGWLVGNEVHKHLTLTAPDARVRSRWLTAASAANPRVTFSRPVRKVAYGSRGHMHRATFSRPRRSVSLGAQDPAGTILVASAVRSWERFNRPRHVSWFPASSSPSVVSSPAPGSEVSPATPLRLTFSKPVARVLGSGHPTIAPKSPGTWRQTDSHTLIFEPSGYGAGLATDVKAELPHRVAVVAADGSVDEGRSISWTIPAGSILRLQQLLAQAGYLPVDWKPDGAPVKRTPLAEIGAAAKPPKGSFSWRYHNIPSELGANWSPGTKNLVTQGAVMAFEDNHGMAADGVAGADVWRALIQDTVDGKHNPASGYSFVTVSESIPETVTLWHNGRKVMTTDANTGIPGQDTPLGTFPVYLHLSSTTMSGTNPDGSHYNDPGVMWVSYFNGGDALHAFDRPSYGTPQSLGCVEMPLAEAGKLWPYTPVGTLVSVVS